MMPLSHQLAELSALGLAGPFGDDWLRIGAMKLYADGAGRTTAFSGTPATGSDRKPTFFHPPGELERLVREAHDTGWQVGIHSIGDLAMQVSLDAIEGAMRATPRDDVRHRIEHFSYPTEAHIRRAASLGVIPVTQPGFVSELGDVTGRNLPAHIHWSNPLRSELEAGATVVISSDSYVVSYRPLDTIASAVTRRTRTGDTLGPDQVLTVEEAVRAHTIDAARSLHLEDRIGSLEPGKLADLSVIDGNLLDTPADRIGDLGIWLTVLDGRIAYAAAD
jgi:predicted amidohydrolase YtcJ